MPTRCWCAACTSVGSLELPDTLAIKVCICASWRFLAADSSDSRRVRRRISSIISCSMATRYRSMLSINACQASALRPIRLPNSIACSLLDHVDSRAFATCITSFCGAAKSAAMCRSVSGATVAHCCKSLVCTLATPKRRSLLSKWPTASLAIRLSWSWRDQWRGSARRC